MYIDIWWSFYRVCLLVRVRMWAFWDHFFSLYSLCHVFWEWDECPSFRSFESLSLPSLHSFQKWLHFMLVLRGSSLLFVLFASPSFSFLLLIHHFCFTPCSYLTTTCFEFDTPFTSSLLISLSVWFASLPHYYYYLHIGHPWVYGSRDFLYMLHFTHEDMGFLSLGIWT